MTYTEGNNDQHGEEQRPELRGTTPERRGTTVWTEGNNNINEGEQIA
jgi:hypothetical protein